MSKQFLSLSVLIYLATILLSCSPEYYSNLSKHVYNNYPPSQERNIVAK
jgi:hypothetical protein